MARHRGEVVFPVTVPEVLSVRLCMKGSSLSIWRPGF